MGEYVIKYGRDARVKYISHLDFMRCFHRAVRRSKLNFVFSQGFNPHPVMTVAQPLPVGVTSECEYMRVGFVTDMDCEEIKAELAGNMPPGFTVYAVCKAEGKKPDITKLNRAEYLTEVECPAPCDTADIMAKPELTVPKKTKSGIKDSDIRPYIYELEDKGYKDGIQTVRMVVSCGSGYNLKPETVIAAMGKYGKGFEPGFCVSHKLDMTADGKPLI